MTMFEVPRDRAPPLDREDVHVWGVTFIATCVMNNPHVFQLKGYTPVSTRLYRHVCITGYGGERSLVVLSCALGVYIRSWHLPSVHRALQY